MVPGLLQLQAEYFREQNCFLTDFRCSGVVGLKGDSLGNHDHFTEGAAYGARDAGYRLRKASF